MSKLSVQFGGITGQSLELSEATNLLVVRTHSGHSVKDTNLGSQKNRSLSEKEVVFALPHVGVEVLKVGNAKSRNTYRKSLKQENEIRFAGRAFKLGNTEVPVLYTENLFIKFVDELSKDLCEGLIAKEGLVIKRSLPYAKNAYFVSAVEGTGRDVFSLPDILFKNKQVELCHPELIMPRKEKAASSEQWHLHETKVNGINVDAHANVADAWHLSVGRDTVIAVIDDGMDEIHEEFSTPDKIVAARDVTLDRDGAAPGFNNNHGTACAGVACGNGFHGASGVAPEAQLMPIRLASVIGSFDEAEAFYHATQNGADIISCSWGPYDGDWWNPNDPLHNEVFLLPDHTRLAINYALEHGRDGKGCVVTWAAGNGRESVDNDGYASHPGVIAVAACNDRGTYSVYSDYGNSILCCFPSDDSESVEYSSPVPLTPGIWTTDRSYGSGYNYGSSKLGDPSGNYTNSFGGTSSSCPGVAGIAALILSTNPNLTWEEVRQVIIDSCDQIDPAGGHYDTNGHSVLYGFGRANAARAVANAIGLGGIPKPSIRLDANQQIRNVSERSDAKKITLPDDFTEHSLELFKSQVTFMQELLEASREKKDF